MKLLNTNFEFFRILVNVFFFPITITPYELYRYYTFNSPRLGPDKWFEKWFNSVMFYFKVEDKEITDFIKLMYEPEFEKLRDKEEELYMGSITIIDGGGKPPFGSEGFIKHS